MHLPVTENVPADAEQQLEQLDRYPAAAIVHLPVIEAVRCIDRFGDESGPLESAELLEEAASDSSAGQTVQMSPDRAQANRTTVSSRPPPLPAGRTGSVPAIGTFEPPVATPAAGVARNAPSGAPSAPAAPQAAQPPPIPPSGAGTGAFPRQSRALPATPPLVPVPPPKPAIANDEVSSLMAEIMATEAPGGRKATANVGRVSEANWFAEIFDDTWPRLASERAAAQTARETRFIAESLNVGAATPILDLGCGYGRHCIELAARGLDVTGLDLSRPLLERALSEARRRNVPVKYVHGDMRSLSIDAAFGAAYCVQGTLGYFDDHTNLEVLAALGRAVVPGGRVLIEVPNRDHLIARIPRRHWWEAGDVVLMEEIDIDHASSRLNVTRTLVIPSKDPWEQRISMRLYSVHELVGLLAMAGMTTLEVSGDIAYRGVYLGAGDRSVWVLAQRR